ncbi:MAG: hypothetical protein HQM12_19500 [SAR324 cluster bacterium]|nr:hypothetical protein [SAR324 cluster bacterium]
MTVQKVNKETVDEIFNSLSKWDFSLTKRKLMESGEAWSPERADAAEENYKRFLAVMKVTGSQLVPNKDIDRFWHEHMLDTRRYVNDSFDLFGAFLHHYPYFGMRGDQDKESWVEASNKSNQVWESYFGIPLYNLALQDSPQKCPGACPNPGIATLSNQPGIEALLDPEYPREAIPHGHGLSFKKGIADGLLEETNHQNTIHSTHTASYRKGLDWGKKLQKIISYLFKK